MIISGWRSTGRLLPPSLCGPRHSGSGELFQTSSRQTLDQVASNLRTSCEQTDNAFKKRVEEVQIRFDFRCDNKIMDAAYEKPTFCPKVREAKQKLEKQKAETIVKLQEVLNLHHSVIIIIPSSSFLSSTSSCKKLLCGIFIFQISYYTNDRPHQH